MTAWDTRTGSWAGTTVSLLPSITKVSLIRTSEGKGEKWLDTKSTLFVLKRVTISARSLITASNSGRKSLPRTTLYVKPGTTGVDLLICLTFHRETRIIFILSFKMWCRNKSFFFCIITIFVWQIRPIIIFVWQIRPIIIFVWQIRPIMNRYSFLWWGWVQNWILTGLQDSLQFKL